MGESSDGTSAENGSVGRGHDESLSRLMGRAGEHVIEGVTGTAVLAAEADGIVAVMNTAAEKLLGVPAARVIGLQHLSAVLHAAHPLGPEPEEGQPQDWLVVDGAGRTKVVSVRARALRDPTGSKDGYLVLAEDVSDRRESEVLLRDAARMQDEAVQRLTELEWARTVFIETASHELRTPLTSILGYTELLMEGAAGALSPDQLEMVSRVEANSERLFSLVEDLLDLSGLDDRTAAGDHVPVDPNVLAQHAWEKLQPFLAQQGLRGHLETDASGMEIPGDAVQLERALVNLLKNAATFTPEGGTVRLTVRSCDEGVEYVVADTGIGLPASERPFAFEPFFRTRVAHSRAIAGGGVGLSIVRRVAEAHGGHVRILPNQGTGTAVVLALPLDTSPALLSATGPSRLNGLRAPMAAPTVEPRGVEAELRAALGGAVDQLVLHYQPIVDLTSGTVVAVESLVRWQHPLRGLLAPDEFVPVAETSSLVHAIGDWVLERALRDAGSLVHEGRELDVAVNVSARQLDDRTVTNVELALARYGVRPGRLTLEVTESALIEDEDLTASVYQGLSKLGVKIAIDDFGTGFTSLLHLRRHPIDSLKIDRRFVAGLTGSANDEAMCTSIIGLAGAVGASTVGEGIETAAQYAALRSLGCSRGQGFLWSPAVPLDQLSSALASSDRVAEPPRRSHRATAGVPTEVTSMIMSMHAEGASLHTIAAALNSTLGPHADGRRWTAPAVARGLAAARHAEAAGSRTRAVAGPAPAERRQW